MQARTSVLDVTQIHAAAVMCSCCFASLTAAQVLPFLQAAASLNGARMGEKPLHVSIQPLKQRPPRAAAGLPASMQ